MRLKQTKLARLDSTGTLLIHIVQGKEALRKPEHFLWAFAHHIYKESIKFDGNIS
jgi:hypothetical protein